MQCPVNTSVELLIIQAQVDLEQGHLSAAKTFVFVDELSSKRRKVHLLSIGMLALCLQVKGLLLWLPNTDHHAHDLKVVKSLVPLGFLSWGTGKTFTNCHAGKIPRKHTSGSKLHSCLQKEHEKHKHGQYTLGGLQKKQLVKHRSRICEGSRTSSFQALCVCFKCLKRRLTNAIIYLPPKHTF